MVDPTGIEDAARTHCARLLTSAAAQRDPQGAEALVILAFITRSQVPELKLTMADLWNHIGSLPDLLAKICDRYARFRTGSPIDEPGMCEAFVKGCWLFADRVHPLGIGQCIDPVFEGAQGLLMDQDNKEFFPHVTPSNTGLKNVRTLCGQAGISNIEAYYVSRTYLTRHGAGPLPGEDSKLKFEDATNIEHPYQGPLRFAPLDIDSLARRIKQDANGTEYRTVLTHCDQLAAPFSAHRHSDGETRDAIH